MHYDVCIMCVCVCDLKNSLREAEDKIRCVVCVCVCVFLFFWCVCLFEDVVHTYMHYVLCV
jgi:hypothetical protein